MLANAITNYSDGYKATSTLFLETFMAGSYASWKGYCMVYYSSEYVMDSTNGSICHVALQSADNVMGVSAQYLLHIPADSWSPPSSTASVTPTSMALTDAKYNALYVPAGSEESIYYAGHYAQVSWYQPKFGSSYTLVARYGSGDYVGAYCMMGSAGSSSFIPYASAVSLSGAAALAASAVVLGSTFLVM